MGARQYCVQNKTKDSSLNSSVTAINATLEPLAILKVLIEGLASNEETGIWLTHVIGIPMVPRISPFDIVYLDKENRVVNGAELLPVGEFPPFKKPSVSALVLPLRTLASTKTLVGDQLIISEIEDSLGESSEESVDEVATTAVIEFSDSQAVSIPGDAAISSFELDAAEPEHQAADPELAQITITEAPAEEAELDEVASAAVEENEPVSVSSGSEPDTAVSTLRAEPSPSAKGSVSRFEVHVKPETEQAESAATEKGWMVTRLLRWLYPGTYETDRRSGRRIPIPELVAYDASNGVPRAFAVDNVSSSGIFLITEERWAPGSVISLSMQREGSYQKEIHRRIQFQAGAVRWAENGIGLAFMLPTGMDLRFWERPSKDGTKRSEPEYVVREFNMARALAFIGRISPPALAESKRLLHEELSNVRADYVVNVALKAEQRLAQEIDGDKMLAHPDLILRIVQSGSWADSEWIQDLWAGLLTTSCSRDGQDDSNLAFIKIFGQLALIQIRILTSVCAKAATTVSASGRVVSEKIFSSSADLTRMAGSQDLLKIHRSVAQLSEFGLLEKSSRSSFVSNTEGTTTTPTSLGLRMYARCLGRRGDV